MQQPSVQYSIRFLDFFVPSIKMVTGSHFKKEINNQFNIELGFELGYDLADTKRYSVTFNIAISNEDNSYSLSLAAVAFFESKDDITEDFKNSHFAKTNSPAIAFPFVRSFINTLTTNAGFNPIILPSFNFAKLEQTPPPNGI